MQNTRVTTLAAYRDMSGMFTTRLEDVAAFEKRAEQAFTGEKPIEDEDELLYGDADAKEVLTRVKCPAPPSSKPYTSDERPLIHSAH